MGFFDKPKPIPSFTSRAEAFDFMFSHQVNKGVDMLAAAEQANKFADIVAQNKKLPDAPQKPLNAIEKGMVYLKQLAELKSQNPDIWDMLTGIAGGVIGGFTGSPTTVIEEPKPATIDFNNLD